MLKRILGSFETTELENMMFLNFSFDNYYFLASLVCLGAHRFLFRLPKRKRGAPSTLYIRRNS